MDTGADMAAVAALVGDPARANILAELLGGRALTAGELAGVAGVSASTASGHLARLTDAGLLTRARRGRHSYFRLASAEVAAMLEALMMLASPSTPKARATPRIPPKLRTARTCYDHIAGELGVGIADGLIASGALILAGEGAEVTDEGRRRLEAFGLPPPSGAPTRRLYCRCCLDWSERRPHLAGTLGAQILQRSLQLGWVRRAPSGRALAITPAGQAGFRETFGV